MTQRTAIWRIRRVVDVHLDEVVAVMSELLASPIGAPSEEGSRMAPSSAGVGDACSGEAEGEILTI